MIRLAEERANLGGDECAFLFESEVAGIEQVQFGFGKMSAQGAQRGREQHGVADSWHAELGWVDGYQYAMLDTEWRRLREGHPRTDAT